VLFMSLGKAPNYIQEKILAIFPLKKKSQLLLHLHLWDSEQEIETITKSGTQRKKSGGKKKNKKRERKCSHTSGLNLGYCIIELICACICHNLIQYDSSFFPVYQTASALAIMLPRTSE